ncbi:hypothetical protein D7W79_18585 [Corallococcus exercitus]|nr:hypothetical protein D7W79_18585 [Corallococcus exercitus]
MHRGRVGPQRQMYWYLSEPTIQVAPSGEQGPPGEKLVQLVDWQEKAHVPVLVQTPPEATHVPSLHVCPLPAAVPVSCHSGARAARDCAVAVGMELEGFGVQPRMPIASALSRRVERVALCMSTLGASFGRSGLSQVMMPNAKRRIAT